MKRIGIMTGTRAEYGLLKSLMQEINKDNDLELYLIVSGMHLSPEFGMTYQEIEEDGFEINAKVEMLLSSSFHYKNELFAFYKYRTISEQSDPIRRKSGKSILCGSTWSRKYKKD